MPATTIPEWILGDIIDPATGRVVAGVLAAEAMADAIVRAATEATSLPGHIAARDLNRAEE
ncbi:MAG: hypothetical protein V3S30_06645 [Thermoanaerobaculia bacterium]